MDRILIYTRNKNEFKEAHNIIEKRFGLNKKLTWTHVYPVIYFYFLKNDLKKGPYGINRKEHILTLEQFKETYDHEGIRRLKKEHIMECRKILKRNRIPNGYITPADIEILNKNIITDGYFD